MRLLKFVSLMPEGTQALKVAEREAQRPQRPGTVLAELAEREETRAALLARAADPSISAEEREALEDHLHEVIALQDIVAEDMRTDPGGYLAWFWAEANDALLQQAQRFRQ